jgi:hypothetical protein
LAFVLLELYGCRFLWRGTLFFVPANVHLLEDILDGFHAGQFDVGFPICTVTGIARDSNGALGASMVFVAWKLECRWFFK